MLMQGVNACRMFVECDQIEPTTLGGGLTSGVNVICTFLRKTVER